MLTTLLFTAGGRYTQVSLLVIVHMTSFSVYFSVCLLYKMTLSPDGSVNELNGVV